MKHKVGDKVQIKSIDWYYTTKNSTGFVTSMKQYCGKIATITKIRFARNYNLDIDGEFFIWTDEMFEENIKDMEAKEIVLPKGWEVDKIENGKIILKETKKELPKTWEGCCDYLIEGEHITDNSSVSRICTSAVSDDEQNVLPIGLGKPMLALCQLLVCREIYRQGWKPDWNDDSSKYCIIPVRGEVSTSVTEHMNRVLSFQSSEVRDEFLKNFKDLIEEAKEMI